MRIRLMLTIAAALAVSASGADAKTQPKPCPKPKKETKRQPWSVETLVRPRIVVYNYSTNGGSYGHTGVCNRVTGKRFMIEDLDVFDRDSVAIAGWRVAYVYSTGDIINDYNELYIIDVRTGRTDGLGGTDLAREGAIQRLALRPSGALAWSEDDGIFACRVCMPPHSYAKIRQLAGGAANSSSLRVTHRGVRWREHGKWRYARLP